MGISSGKGPRVAVLMGGHSLEREVSLVSGQACSAALRGKDFQVIELDAGLDVVQRLSELRPDVVFNACMVDGERMDLSKDCWNG